MNEPWEKRSNTKQDQFNKEANSRAKVFLLEKILPILRRDLSVIIGNQADLYIDENDPQTICFAYPKIFQTESVLQMIRLEIGALAAWTPAKRKIIHPYTAECYPKAFEKAEVEVLTAAAERTFWEKVTILHHEANRPDNLEMPSRYSRHYYDLYCIAHSENKEAAPGSIHLLPPEYRFEALETDYQSMSEMIFGEYPSFDELMEFIKQLEIEINSPCRSS